MIKSLKINFTRFYYVLPYFFVNFDYQDQATHFSKIIQNFNNPFRLDGYRGAQVLKL